MLYLLTEFSFLYCGFNVTNTSLATGWYDSIKYKTGGGDITLGFFSEVSWLFRFLVCVLGVLLDFGSMPCVFLCEYNWPAWGNAFSQSGHWYGFSPVCILSCWSSYKNEGKMLNLQELVMHKLC